VKKRGIVDPAKSYIHVIKYERKGAFFPISCMQCRKPVCRDVCPVGAIEENPTTGALVVNNDKCLGCKLCNFACPFGGIVVDYVLGIATKCDLCGGEPACAKVCSRDCIKFIDVDKISAELKRKGIRQLAKLEWLITGGEK
jgi:Fe-S-cluster-containing hydrogenase component 2